MVGSNDPGYTASKLAPYLLAGRPLLALMHRQSAVVEMIHRCGGGVVVPFSDQDQPEALAQRVAADWLDNNQYALPLPLDALAFAPHTAAAQARILVQFFRRCLQP